MIRFLVVDDSLFMRTSIKKILENYGYTVIGEADNGKDAVERYKELSPDVVTLDITMNIMSGTDALKEIVKYDANANVLMVSAMGQDSIVEAALAAGAKGFLIKPFKPDAVIATVSKLFADI